MESKTVKKYLITAAAFAVIGAFFCFVMSGYGFLGYGFFAAAAVTLLLFATAAVFVKKEKTERTVRKFIFWCVFAFCIALAVTEVIIASDAKTTASDEDYVVVLGAGVYGEAPSKPLRWRIEAAAEFLSEHPYAVCIASGGQGEGENITEAECIYRELTALGIDGERIIKEEKSASTRENIEFSREIMDELSGGKGYSCAIVTNDFHLCRAKMLAYRAGLEVAGISAKTRYPVLAVNYYFREAFGLWSVKAGI